MDFFDIPYSYTSGAIKATAAATALLTVQPVLHKYEHTDNVNIFAPIYSNHLRELTAKSAFFKKIREFIQLNENWDGYNSVAVLPKISVTGSILISALNSSALKNISDIFPNPHGTLSIEWENNSNQKLSLELGERNYSYFINYNNKKNPKLVNGKDIISDIDAFTQDLEEFIGKQVPNNVL